tara:strand:- start:185 stop:721 length:537 start_codon:yes stop_codon:yes gene_type:complete
VLNTLTLFSGPYALIARWAVLAIACLALWCHGWFKGDEHGSAKLVTYIGAQATASTKVQAKQVLVTEKVVKRYVDRVQVIKETGNEIEKVVTVAVTPKDDDACRINNGYLRLHNAAATDTVPAPTHPADGAASGLRLSQTLGVVAGNYSTCHETAARLIALQEWVREQYKLTNGEGLQ